MITMEILGKIRRMYLRDKLSLHEITKQTGFAMHCVTPAELESHAGLSAYWDLVRIANYAVLWRMPSSQPRLGRRHARDHR